MFMMSIIPLNKINNTIKVINKSSIICNSHAQHGDIFFGRCLFFVIFLSSDLIEYPCRGRNTLL